MDKGGRPAVYLSERERRDWLTFCDAVLRTAKMSRGAFGFVSCADGKDNRWFEKALRKSPTSVATARKVAAALFSHKRTMSAVHSVMAETLARPGMDKWLPGNELGAQYEAIREGRYREAGVAPIATLEGAERESARCLVGELLKTSAVRRPQETKAIDTLERVFLEHGNAMRELYLMLDYAFLVERDEGSALDAVMKARTARKRRTS